MKNPAKAIEANGPEKILSNLDIVNSVHAENEIKGNAAAEKSSAMVKTLEKLVEPCKNIGRLWKEYGIKMKAINEKWQAVIEGGRK